jgi:hypothetical protein
VRGILVLAAVLLAGCAASPPTLTAGSGHSVTVTCPSRQISPNTVTLADFKVAWVLRCPFRINDAPQISERADGPAAALTELVRQLRMPSEPTPTDAICAAPAMELEFFALVDAAGNGVRPDVPTYACGEPHQGVLDALGALNFHQVSGNGWTGRRTRPSMGR